MRRDEQYTYYENRFDLKDKTLLELIHDLVDFYKKNPDANYLFENIQGKKLDIFYILRQYERDEREQLEYQIERLESRIGYLKRHLKIKLKDYLNPRKEGLDRYKIKMENRKIKGEIDQQMLAKYTKKMYQYKQEVKCWQEQNKELKEKEDLLVTLNKEKEIRYGAV